MKRKALLFFFLTVLVGFLGCARSQNPLDWEIGGRSLNSLDRWLSKNAPLMPPTVANELQSALFNIATLLPKRDKNSENEIAKRLAQEIQGQTVRQVIIRGLQIEIDTMHARINNQSATLVRIISTDADNDPVQQQRKARMVEGYQKAIDHLKAEQARHEKRLAELKTGVSP